MTSLSLFTFMHWRRKWQPPPVFLPGESQGRGSLVGCRLWGLTGLDTIEATLAAVAEYKTCMSPRPVPGLTGLWGSLWFHQDDSGIEVTL